MIPPKQRETARKRIDPFATEWAMWDGDQPYGEQEQEESEDAQPRRRAPLSSIDKEGRPAVRESGTFRKLGGAA
jgi:hypothetical protein